MNRPPLVREDGWESRLALVVAAATDAPYELGRHDCFRFACACAEALTGVDLSVGFTGKYKSRLGALRLARKFAGMNAPAFMGLRTAITKLLGVADQPPRMARRGDWLLFNDGSEDHIGICVGGEIAVLAEVGLNRVRFDDCICCWAVG
jgi:hypothetical protein